MRLAEAYRSLARPSSALEPSHPLAGISSLCPTKLSERLVAKLVHGLLGPMICGQTGLNPSTSSRPQCVHWFNGLAGIRTQGLCLAKAALYQLSYKP
jgi:hypothetical protein